jgi:hypothetical protein
MTTSVQTFFSFPFSGPQPSGTMTIVRTDFSCDGEWCVCVLNPLNHQTSPQQKLETRSAQDLYVCLCVCARERVRGPWHYNTNTCNCIQRERERERERASERDRDSHTHTPHIQQQHTHQHTHIHTRALSHSRTNTNTIVGQGMRTEAHGRFSTHPN